MVESANESSNTPLFDFHKKILQALAKYAKIWFEKKIFLKKNFQAKFNHISQALVIFFFPKTNKAISELLFALSTVTKAQKLCPTAQFEF